MPRPRNRSAFGCHLPSPSETPNRDVSVPSTTQTETQYANNIDEKVPPTRSSTVESSATLSSRPRALSDPSVSSSRPPSTHLLGESRLFTPENGISLQENLHLKESTISESSETSGSRAVSKHAVKLKREEIRQTQIAASKYQRQHDMRLAKMRYKLKKRRLGLLERKRVDRRARHDNSHKCKMVKLKLRRLKAKLRHSRAELSESHEEQMGELKARILEIELGRKAQTERAAEHHRGWKDLVPSWTTLSLVGRDIRHASRLVQNMQAGVSWAPRAALEMRRLLRRPD